MVDSKKRAFFTNSIYNGLKFLALIVLPALATLYITVDGFWHIGYTTQVVGTITAIDTFLGTILRISTTRYYKNESNFDGDVIVTPQDGGSKASFAFNQMPEDLVDVPGKHSMELRVVRVKRDGS